METITATTAQEPTMADLESMINASRSAEPVAETKTPETPVKTEEQRTEPEPGTGKNQQQEEVEEELPEGVKKRIAAEAKKQAFFQSKIDQAVSARKAKEAEAAKVTGEPGSEPDKQKTEPAKSERPKRPELATFDGTLAEYNAAVAKADEALEKWLEDRTRETVSKELTERQAKEAQQKEWEAATAKHGADFPALMDALAAKTPVGLQRAISELDDWSTVALHLAKDDAEHSALVEEFKERPARAIAKLGKLEDRLKPAATEAAAKKEETPLPKPLKPVGGDAPGRNGRVDIDKASDADALGEIGRMLKAS